MDAWVSIIFAVIFGVSGLAFGIISAASNVRKSATDEGNEHGETRQSLANIFEIVTEIKRDINDVKSDVRNFGERIVRVETCRENDKKIIDDHATRIRIIEQTIKVNEER